MNRNKILLSMLAAVTLLTSCSKTDEVNTEPNNSSNSITKVSEPKTISDIEYILKNELEIDGVSVSVPCTKDELLTVLGEEYSFDEVNRLLYNGEETMAWVVTDYNNENMVITIGFMYDNALSETAKGIITFKSAEDKQPYSLENILKVYTIPYIETEVDENSNKIRVQFYKEDNIDDSEAVIQCVFADNEIKSIVVSLFK